MLRTKDYVKPYPYLGEKKVCFECLQRGDAQKQIVILQNHRGFLCETCALTSVSANVANGLRAYNLVKLINQPTVGDLAEEILTIADTGFRGKAVEWFQILRERDKHNHLLLRSARIALEFLSDVGHLNESYELSIDTPIYYSSEAQKK